MHTSIQWVVYGFRSPWTGIIFSLILKEGLSLTTEHNTEQVSPNLQPQFLYGCSLQLQGSHITIDELEFRRSKQPARLMPEASQWEMGNLCCLSLSSDVLQLSPYGFSLGSPRGHWRSWRCPPLTEPEGPPLTASLVQFVLPLVLTPIQAITILQSALRAYILHQLF